MSVQWNVTINGAAAETNGLINWYSTPNTGIALSPIALITFGLVVGLADIYTDCTTPEDVTWVECECETG